MIWYFVEWLKTIPIVIRHFFRKMVCKEYDKFRGFGSCRMKDMGGWCEWDVCPKRKENQTETRRK